MIETAAGALAGLQLSRRCTPARASYLRTEKWMVEKTSLIKFDSFRWQINIVSSYKSTKFLYRHRTDIDSMSIFGCLHPKRTPLSILSTGGASNYSQLRKTVKLMNCPWNVGSFTKSFLDTHVSQKYRRFGGSWPRASGSNLLLHRITPTFACRCLLSRSSGANHLELTCRCACPSQSHKSCRWHSSTTRTCSGSAPRASPPENIDIIDISLCAHLRAPACTCVPWRRCSLLHRGVCGVGSRRVKKKKDSGSDSG